MGQRVMEIADLVTPAGVVPSLKASSKKQALQELARKASDLSTLDEREWARFLANVIDLPIPLPPTRQEIGGA